VRLEHRGDEVSATTTHVKDLRNANEVVGRDSLSDDALGHPRHRPVERCAGLGVVLRIAEERFVEDNFEPWLASADGVVELAPSGKGLAAEVQRHVTHRSAHV
jgi:hypothetical protein